MNYRMSEIINKFFYVKRGISMNQWYISTLSEYPCIQVSEYRHEKYSDSLLSVLFFEFCECDVFTEDYEKPEFVFSKVVGLDKLKYGININGPEPFNNIKSISVTALPWHDFGVIKKFPEAMSDQERQRILKITAYDHANHFLLMGEEGWEEKEIGFWLFGDIELSNASSDEIEIICTSR